MLAIGCNILLYSFHNLNSQIHIVSCDAMTFIVTIYKSRRPVFTSVQQKFNRDICCCVEWTSLVFLDAACYTDVAFHIPTEGRGGPSSCYATSLSVSNYDLQYDVHFVTSL